MATAKRSSGAGRLIGVFGHPRKLKKMAAQGEMPTYIIAGEPGKRGEALEMIDRYYKMPDSRYLKEAGIRADEGWHLETPSGRRGYDSTKTDEYFLRQRITMNGHVTFAYAPFESTFEARQGALKFTIYHMLRINGKLDKKEFIRDKK